MLYLFIILKWKGFNFMVQFIGYLLPCIVFAYILLTKRKAYSLLLLIFYILNLISIFVLHDLNRIEITVLYSIEGPLFIIGAILLYKDYTKNKKN